MKIQMVILVALICGLFIGCSSDVADRQKANNEAAWQACIDQGGIPIHSSWSVQMADCVFKPASR